MGKCSEVSNGARDDFGLCLHLQAEKTGKSVHMYRLARASVAREWHMRIHKKYIFVVDEGWEDPNATISGPVNETPFKGRFAEMAFRWRADDGLTLNACSVAS